MPTFLQVRAGVLGVSDRLRRRAFTLVELLVAMTVLLILVLMMVGLTDQTNKIWRTSRARIEAFQGARAAFERVTANLSQATLNTYLDYYNAAHQSRTDVIRRYGETSSQFTSFQPVTYDRAADLQFICGQSDQGTSPLIPPKATNSRPTHALFFQCPLQHVSDLSPSGSTNDFNNLTRLLNAVGYYVEFNNQNDTTVAGSFPKFITTLPASWRYRLMELNQPSQNLGIYFSSVAYENTNPTVKPWFQLAVDPITTPPPAPVLVMAENVIALIVRPKLANPTPNSAATQNSPGAVNEIAPNYAYDTKGYTSAAPTDPVSQTSKNQLPPLVQITLVAIDADSATRLAAANSSTPSTPPPLVDPALFLSPEPPGTTTYTFNTFNQTYTSDLNALELKLQGLRLNYRVFVTDVSIPGAKWTN